MSVDPSHHRAGNCECKHSFLHEEKQLTGYQPGLSSADQEFVRIGEDYEIRECSRDN